MIRTAAVLVFTHAVIWPEVVEGIAAKATAPPTKVAAAAPATNPGSCRRMSGVVTEDLQEVGASLSEAPRGARVRHLPEVALPRS
jgi:hypothetical protein